MSNQLSTTTGPGSRAARWLRRARSAFRVPRSASSNSGKTGLATRNAERGTWNVVVRRGLLVLLTACGLGELPSAAHGLETLVVSIAKLRYDNSIASDNGSLKIRALVDDNSTVGQLRLGLVAGTVAVEISDGGQFNITVVISGCKLTRSEGVRCRSSDGSVRANFVPTAQGPYIYNMRLQARRLADTVTGTALPVGPVSVVMHQPGADRPDVISDCGPDSLFTMVCREL